MKRDSPRDSVRGQASPRRADFVLHDGVRLEHIGEAPGSDVDCARSSGTRQGVWQRLLHLDGLLLDGDRSAKLITSRTRNDQQQSSGNAPLRRKVEAGWYLCDGVLGQPTALMLDAGPDPHP